MNFSQKAKEHIDSCRFCWMCHHVCPVGNATGLERNTARARALGLSLVARGAVEYSEDIINNVYECTLCGGCMTDCVTGWDPVMFAKEARLGAALDGKLPEYVLKMINNLTEKGSIYGAEKNPNIWNGQIHGKYITDYQHNKNPHHPQSRNDVDIIYDLITTKTTIIPALHIFFLSASHILPEILSDTPDE